MKRSKRAKRGKLKASIFFMYMYHRKKYIMSSILRPTVSLFLSITLSLSLLASNQILDESITPRLRMRHSITSYSSVNTAQIQPDALPKLHTPQEESAYQIDVARINNAIDRRSPRMIIAMKKKRDCNKATACLCRWFCWPCACVLNKIASSNN